MTQALPVELQSCLSNLQAAADPRFAHKLRQQWLGRHVATGAESSAEAPAEGATPPEHSAAAVAVQRCIDALRLSDQQAARIAGGIPDTLTLCFRSTSHPTALNMRMSSQ